MVNTGIIENINKTHLEDGDKLVWYNNSDIVATWHENGRVDLLDRENISICEAVFRITKGHWRETQEHGVGMEPQHWYFKDHLMKDILDEVPDFWKPLGKTVRKDVTQSKDSTESKDNKEDTDDIFSKSPVFYLNRTLRKEGIAVNAEMKITAKGFAIRKGATVSSNCDYTSNRKLSDWKKDCYSKGLICGNTLMTDMAFPTISSAAMFIVGNNANGFMEFKDINGITFKDRLESANKVENTEEKLDDNDGVSLIPEEDFEIDITNEVDTEVNENKASEVTDEFIKKIRQFEEETVDIYKLVYNDSLNEENTKNKFILPFIKDCLGYNGRMDIESELVVKVGKHSDRLDYALIKNYEPYIAIECKKLNERLYKDIDQLKGYFQNIKSVHVGILTNGVDFWFYTDSKDKNILDDEPYRKINITVLSDDDIKFLWEYTKDNIENANIPCYEKKEQERLRQIQEEARKHQEELDKKDAEIAKLKEALDNQESTEVYDATAAALAVNAIIENDKFRKEIKELRKSKDNQQNKKEIFKRNRELNKQEVPENIAKDMIDLLPEEAFVPETKVLDPFCRYGELLIAFKNRAMISDAMIKAYPDEEDREDYIRNNMLYGIVVDSEAYTAVTRIIHKTAYPRENHIAYIGNNEQYMLAMKNNPMLFLKENFKRMGKEDMKFDVVVGNPPYNNDIYIPFVEMGHNLASTCSVFITPAKWQAKGGQKNEQFRKEIVPHMSKIVYYPDSCDIFDIALGGGVSYYIIDKKIHIDKVVNGNYINDFDANMPLDITEEERAIVNKIKSINSNTILNKFEPKLSWNTILSFSGDHYRDDMEHVGSGYWLVDKNKRIEIDTKYVKEASKAEMWQTVHGPYSNKQCTASIYKPHEIAPSYAITLYAGNKDDVLSADSYYKCKLIWWLVARFFGSSGLNTKSFSLVPDPGAFDHIFTDEELYKKYNLTPEEINIIESVIKCKGLNTENRLLLGLYNSGNDKNRMRY